MAAEMALRMVVPVHSNIKVHIIKLVNYNPHYPSRYCLLLIEWFLWLVDAFKVVRGT